MSFMLRLLCTGCMNWSLQLWQDPSLPSMVKTFHTGDAQPLLWLLWR